MEGKRMFLLCFWLDGHATTHSLREEQHSKTSFPFMLSAATKRNTLPQYDMNFSPLFSSPLDNMMSHKKNSSHPSLIVSASEMLENTFRRIIPRI